jgi:hypothetical protein
MPFTGQYTYTDPEEYAAQQVARNYGTTVGNLTAQQYDQRDFSPNKYYGMTKSQIANSITGGDFNKWFPEYAKQFTEMNGGIPKMVNGQVATPVYQDPGDAEGLAVMAALTAGMGGMAAGAAAAGGAGAGAAGSGAGATGAFDMGIGGVGESMGLGGGYTGATGLGGSAMDLGGLSMPPAQLDPSVADFINAGTTPSGGSIFTADGLNPSVLGLGGESAGMWDTIRNLPTNALKALGLTKPDGSADGGALMSLLGKLGAAGLGAYGSSQQSNALTELANKYSEYGAPSRARFEASMTPGFDPSTIPGYAGALDSSSKSILARLSATGGNPFGNPAGLVQANKDIVSGTAMPALGEYQRLNLSAGGLGNLNAAVPALQQGAINADGNVLSALGYGLNAATQQQPQQQSLADLMKAFNIQGLS